MEALLSEFTFLSEQALQDKNFDPSAIEDLMKLFEIESYRAWAAMELEQPKDMEVAEDATQQPEDYLDTVMESAMDEFRRFEEELEKISRPEMNSLVETAETTSIVAENHIEVALNSASASVKPAWKGLASGKVHPS
ncbi:hypothetical protein L6164_036223 [Bauhinia variegata]|uniref:Uncharacterized protein n=1 Tax=Bauhinia variegata TaxID=167791 RepID=A0ACB9KGF3_BAUVA|nr:hypothetical protein L6164_036223 [Bauhinia variegata]